MDKEDTKYYRDFIKDHESKMCEFCGCMVGRRAHHVFRRKKGAGKILIWLCLNCDSNKFLGSHGENESLLRPIYCRVILKNRPDLRNYILDYKPDYVHVLRIVRKEEDA